MVVLKAVLDLVWRASDPIGCLSVSLLGLDLGLGLGGNVDVDVDVDVDQAPPSSKPLQLQRQRGEAVFGREADFWGFGFE